MTFTFPSSNKMTILIIFCFFASSGFSQVQETPGPKKLNSISINVLGDASLISGNFERLHLLHPKLALSGKIGLGFNKTLNLICIDKCPDTHAYLTLPHHITSIYGNGRHFLEMGLGGTLLIGNSTSAYYLYPMAGYRYQPLVKKSLQFRIYLQYPILGFDDSDAFFIPLGFSFGSSF